MVNKADRARQFLPFDALKGYKEAIMAKRKVVIAKKELSEDDAETLSRKLLAVKIGMMIKVIYFHEDEYVAIEGMVSKIKFEERVLMIVKTKINFDDIINIIGVKEDY